MTHVIGLLVCVLLLLPGAAGAVMIEFRATDLADTTLGQDLWSYEYVVSDFDVQPDVAFEVLFDPALYRELQDPPPFVNAGWDVIALQPDSGLPDAGRYSALALLAGASLGDPFTLSFLWLGGPGTAPGVQPFEIVEFDAGGTFIQVLETGLTVPPARAVPEPGMLGLMAGGLLALVLARRRRGLAR